MAEQDETKEDVVSVERLTLVGLNREKAGIRGSVREFRRRVEAALLATGGGGVVTASKVHTACVALRRHLQIEKILTRCGEPGAEAGPRRKPIATNWPAASAMNC